MLEKGFRLKKSFVLIAAVLAMMQVLPAAADITPNDLPDSIVVVTTDGDMQSPGNHSMLTITRSGKEFNVIFRSRLAFDVFVHSLPANRAGTLFTSSVPGSAMNGLVDSGGAVLVDPISENDGGIVLVKKAVPTTDNAELTRLYEADQSERMPPDGKPIDWAVVAPRDEERRKQILSMFQGGAIATGNDFSHAAVIMQHGTKPEDYLMAHDFGIAALKRGKKDAAWIIAASEDRFLESIGRKQRYGTQLGLPMETDGALTDDFRQVLGVPKLAESIEQARTMQKH